DDVGVGQERADLGCSVGGDLPRVEAVESAPVARPLPEDRDPREPGLRALEAQELEEPPVVVERYAPLAVVVRAVKGISGSGPAATDASVGVGRRTVRHGVLLCNHSDGSRWAR